MNTSDYKETLAIGQRGFLIRGADEQIWFRVYSRDAAKPNKEESFVDYEITNYDCEVVIIDPHAAFHRGEHGDFLDYTNESMGIAK